jgi:hypothetical protein
MASDSDNSSGGGEDFGKSGGLADAIKKVFAVGVSAAFMTEESIRAALGEVKLPKEILKNLLDGAMKSKQELLNRVSGETIKMINKIDFVKEASRFVETHKFRVTAEIEVEKKESAKD